MNVNVSRFDVSLLGLFGVSVVLVPGGEHTENKKEVWRSPDEGQGILEVRLLVTERASLFPTIPFTVIIRL